MASEWVARDDHGVHAIPAVQLAEIVEDTALLVAVMLVDELASGLGVAAVHIADGRDHAVAVVLEEALEVDGALIGGADETQTNGGGRCHQMLFLRWWFGCSR